MRRFAANFRVLIGIILLASCTATPTVPSNERAVDASMAKLTARTMLRLELSPDTARIALSGSQVFTVKATYSDGKHRDRSGLFRVDGGGRLDLERHLFLQGSAGNVQADRAGEWRAGGQSSVVIIGGVTPPPPPPPAAPTLTLTSTKPSIVTGDSATLNWVSANATACTASAGWTGSKGLTGTTVVKPTVTTSYTLTCTGAGGRHRSERDGDGHSHHSTTASGSYPDADQQQDQHRGWATARPSPGPASTRPPAPLQRGWTGSKGLTGTAVVKPTVTTSYTLTCSGAGGSIAKSMTEDGHPRRIATARSADAHAHQHQDQHGGRRQRGPQLDQCQRHRVHRLRGGGPAARDSLGRPW